RSGRSARLQRVRRPTRATGLVLRVVPARRARGGRATFAAPHTDRRLDCASLVSDGRIERRTARQHARNPYAKATLYKKDVAAARRDCGTRGGRVGATLAGPSVVLRVRARTPLGRRRVERRDLAATLRPLQLHARPSRARPLRPARVVL